MKSYKVNDILEKMAMEGRRHFSPLYVCERLNTENIKDVVEFLFSDSCKDIIKPNFEVMCPEGDTDFIVHSLDLIPTNDVRMCHLCGTEYIPSLKDIWVTFDFTDGYINHIKKKTRCSLLPMMKNKKKSSVI